MRLRFEGQVYDPRLTYLIQSFSRATWTGTIPVCQNVLRDAMVFYKVSNKLNIALGQGSYPVIVSVSFLPETSSLPTVRLLMPR